MKFWNLKKSEQRSELYLYGDIEATQFWGDEITPQTLVDQLKECAGALDVYINSGGGDVFAGMAIYNILKRYDGEVTVHIDGLAASIASVIAMAGDNIIMPENALMMIHNAWTIAMGNAAELRGTADELERVDKLITDIYTARSGKDADEISDAMADETWLTAEEALDFGLVDEVEANKAIAASISGNTMTINGQQVDMSRYASTERLRGLVTEPPGEDTEEPEEFEEPDNGGEGQPVEEQNAALEKQRSQFDALRRKILETTND